MDAATKRLYIVRGLPSAGKTELAELIAGQYALSLDDCRPPTTMEGGPVIGDFLEAMKLAQQQVEQWMREGRTPIAVAAVNATRSRIGDWMFIAISHGYQWSVVHVETDLTAEDLAARSRTKCPADVITKFRQRWQPWGD